MTGPLGRFGLVTTIALASVQATFAQRPVVPFSSPDQVTFGSSKFALPDPARFEVALGEGLVAYVVEDRQTSTVELTVLVGASTLDDPPGKEGLAEAVAFAMTTAGPSSTTPEEFLRRLDVMEAHLAVTTDLEHTRLSLTLINEDLEQGLDLFARLVREPRLDQSVLDEYRRRGVVRGWDPNEPRARPEIEFPRFIYANHPAGRQPSDASLQSITVADLTAFHRRYFVPNNMVLVASGGIDRAAITTALKQRLVSPEWKKSVVVHAPMPPVPRAEPRKLHVFDSDTIQGWMLVGHLGRQGRQPDLPALEIANYILGGGGAIWKRVHAERPPAVPEGHFYARLFNESRSTRGLTNDTSSYVPAGFRVPGLIYAVTLGRPESMAYLLKIIDQEWRRIGEDVSDADIDIARHALIEGHFQMRYAGAHRTALSLAEDRFFDGGPAWSRGYAAAIQAVTRTEVLEAARKYYRADDLVGVLVGPIDRIRDAEHPLYRARLSDFGELVIHPSN